MKTAFFNSHKIIIGLLCPFAASPIAQHTASHRAQRDYSLIYKSLYIRNKSIALLCQFESKKLQISFVQNAQNLQLTKRLNVLKS